MWVEQKGWAGASSLSLGSLARILDFLLSVAGSLGRSQAYLNLICGLAPVQVVDSGSLEIGVERGKEVQTAHRVGSSQ